MSRAQTAQNEIWNITLTVLFRSPKYRFVPEKPLSSIHFLINLNVPITEANRLEKNHGRGIQEQAARAKAALAVNG